MISVNLKTVLRNIRACQSRLQAGTLFCAVVKANAYSLGDVRIARGIQKHVDMFAVARKHEYIRLRANGISKPILLLGFCDDISTAIENNIIITVGSIQEMRDVCKQSKGAKVSVHIKANTGMSRFGLTSPIQLKTIIDIAQKHPNIAVLGLYTHFSHEYTDEVGKKSVDRQLERFTPFRALFRRYYPCGIIHAACSGTAHYASAQFDMVRIGKAMYGGFSAEKVSYLTPISVTAKIVSVRQIARGSYVGYGGLYTSDKAMVVGVVALGYADALFLIMAKPKFVYIEDKICPILGAVCMDNFMIDVTEIESPIGKTVEIVGVKKGITISDYILRSGHSGARLVCSLCGCGNPNGNEI